MPVALAMILGVMLGRRVEAMPWVWLAGAITMVGVSIACLHRPRTCATLLLIGTMLAAMSATQRFAFYYPRHHITHFITDTPRLGQLRLYLPHQPRLRTMTFGQRFPVPPRQVTLARVTEILTWNGWTPVTGEVLVQIREPHPQLAAGQMVQVIGTLERPGVAMNPGQFDWQRYYRDQGVLCSVQIPHAQNITILTRDPPSILTRLRESARRALAEGFDAEQSIDHALLGALVLGDYDPELRDVKEQFRRTGTSHHLAISGMHVAVVGGAIFLLMRLMRFGPRVCWSVTMACVLFYGLLATPSPPVWRSVILFLAAGSGFLLARFSGVLQFLALTVVLMLAVHPLDLFNAGFQLSFITVLGLILFSEPLTVRFANELDVITPAEEERMSRSHRAARWFDRQSIVIICASVIAWLVSMPLVAAHFTQLNPWAVPASILLAPLVIASLCAGVLKIVMTWLIPSSGPLLATLAGNLSASMRWMVDWLARLPAGDVPLTAPAWWVIALCWIAIALLVVRWRLKLTRAGSFVVVAIAFGYLLVGPYLLGSSRSLQAGQVRITLMAVGAGQCALIEPAGGRTVLIDCGSNSLTDLNSNVVVPVLRDRRHTSIDTIFISHANTDHYSGVAEIADAYGVREIVVGDRFDVSARETATGNALLRELAALELPPRVARPGDSIPLGSRSAIEILWPAAGSTFEANDTSLVARLRANDRTLLFTGDIQADGIEALLNKDVDPKSDVLIAMHHGSSEDNTAALVDRVDPAWILSSNDRTLTGKQKRFDLITQSRRLLRTHEYGAITIVIDVDGSMRVEGFAKNVADD